MQSTSIRKLYDSILQEPLFFGENVNVASYSPHDAFLISFFIAILNYRPCYKSPKKKVTLKKLLLSERKRIRAPPEARSKKLASFI